MGIKSIALAATTLILSTSANAMIVSNGSFETGDFTGWVSTGINNIVTTTEGSTDGIYAASFNGGNVAGSGILSQSITTVIGNTYLLKLDYGVFGAPKTQNLQVELIGASTLLNQTLSDEGNNPNIFAEFSFGFIANSTSTTLSFTDLTTSVESFGADFVIDNISVSAVPVPAAIWLFGSGLLGLAGVARRKKA